MNWDNVNMWLYGVASALIGLVVIFVRKVLTNETKIALMEQSMKNISDDIKSATDDRIRNDSLVEDKLREIKRDIKSLLQHNYDSKHP